MELPPDARSLLRTTLALKVAAEWGPKLKRAAAPFQSDYGEGTIPILVETEDGERGFYIEVPPWTEPVEHECLRWLALLRTSEREDLDMEIKSEAAVPDLLSFYVKKSLRNTFELEGLLAVRWKTEGFARANVTTLKRLAEKHLGTVLADGVEGLRTLDELILEYFSPEGHILPSTVILVGSMVGEFLISTHGGEWRVSGEELEAVVVALPTLHGVADVNVFGKVIKLFSRGAEDSLAAMAVAIDDVLRSSRGA